MTEKFPSHPGGRPTDYKPEYCQQLIDHCATGKSIASFAGLIDVDRKTISNWAREHDEFFLAVTREDKSTLRLGEHVDLSCSGRQRQCDRRNLRRLEHVAPQRARKRRCLPIQNGSRYRSTNTLDQAAAQSLLRPTTPLRTSWVLRSIAFLPQSGDRFEYEEGFCGRIVERVSHGAGIGQSNLPIGRPLWEHSSDR